MPARRGAAGESDMDEPQGPASMFGGPPAGAGSLIRAAREHQGVDLAALAAMLKVPLRKLEALEGGRHGELQGPTFERALAQAACRVLKIDPKPVLAQLPRHAGNTLEQVTGGLNTPFRERPGRMELGELSTVMRPAMLLVAAIVIAALALFFVPAGFVARVARPLFESLHRVPDPAPAAASDPGAAPGADASIATVTAVLPPDSSMPAGDAMSGRGASRGGIGAPISAPAPLALSRPLAGGRPNTTSTAPANAGAIANANANTNARAKTPGGDAPPPAATTLPLAAGAAPVVDEVLAHSEAPPTIPLQVTALADTWVEVHDAQGRSLLSRTVMAGESVGLDGAMPMRVKIGNARGTRLSVRGDNVDLTPWTRDNVARVELK